jgi:CheY-like chemotaxis protein
VLLVDDDDDSLDIFGMYWRYAGAVVTTARNGAEP